MEDEPDKGNRLTLRGCKAMRVKPETIPPWLFGFLVQCTQQGISMVASVRLRRWTVPRVEWIGLRPDGGNLPIETRNGRTNVVCNPRGFSSKDCGHLAFGLA